MDQPFRLPADEVARICAHLLEHQWDWTVANLDEALSSIGWVVREREIDRPLLWLASLEHPRLRGLAQPLEPGDEIIDIVLGVTESADEFDGHGQAQLDGAAEILAAGLPGSLGLPDHYDGRWPVWSGEVCDVELRRITVRVSVAAVHRAHLARYRGNAEEQRPVSAGGSRQAGVDGAWDALGVGLGRLLGSLADLDRVSFEVNDVVVLSASRHAGDLWVLATGPEDTVEPVDLSDDQQAVLADVGFRPTLGERAERSPQRENWWFHLRLPADSLVLESTGHVMVAAVRQVYGAERPAAIVWYSMALSEGAQWVLDSLGLTRSEFQRD